MPAVDRCTQAVVLCGGLGTRLGELTRGTPKPLLPVGGVPFLTRLLSEIRRHGIRRVVLLASYLSDTVRDFVADLGAGPLRDVAITLSIEPERAGTGGALWHARDQLDERFFVFNGDSWFDINLWDLAARAAAAPATLGCLALRTVPDGSRYGVVRLDGGLITAFGLEAGRGPALVNAGVYLFDRRLIDRLGAQSSLEQDALPRLAADGTLAGTAYDGFFIDIGIPSSFAEAQTLIPSRQRRPAVFLDRDGVLNEDLGYVGTRGRFVWRPGAIAMVKLFNDAGWLAFIVTNQAGVAKGKYSEADIADLHAFVADELASQGAHVDDIRYCPFHEEAIDPAYRARSDWRKPAPGMLLDLMAHWPVDRAGSVMIGDKDTDIEAASRAGVTGVLVGEATDLEGLARDIIAKGRRAAPPA